MDEGISIVVPVLNAEIWLSGFGHNILDLIQTTPDPIEIICVDNGSQDRTVLLLKDLCKSDSRIKLRFAGGGIASALNMGVQSARYDWIMRHDVDDFSHPRRALFFRKALKELSSSDVREQIAIVNSHSVLFDAGHHIIGVLSTRPGIEPILPRIRPVNSFVHGSLFIRKSAIEQAGGYRQNLEHLEDVDLWQRLGESNWKVLGLNHYLYWFRIHLASVSTANLQAQMNSASLLCQQEFEGLWSILDRGAIRQLIWSGKRQEAIGWATRTIRLRIPQKSDFFQIIRLVFGAQLDRARGRMLKKRELEIKEFYPLFLDYVSERKPWIAAK